MPVIPFPALRPTTRVFTPPAWPIQQVQSDAGFTEKRLMGSRASDAGLSLQFKSIWGTEAALIQKCYRDSLSGFYPLSLPAIIFEGEDEELAAFMVNAGPGLYWSFPAGSGVPRPTTAADDAGINTVPVQLVALLQAAP